MGLFRFHEQNPAKAQQMIEQGILPWWTVLDLHLAFWRPLAAATHWLDYQLWPHQPWLMHAHSLLWFGGLIAVVTYLYHSLLPTPQHPVIITPFALAVWLYALDEAHGFAIGWLANRNILLAALFGCMAVLTYHKWRHNQWQPGQWLTPLLLLAALFSAESAIAMVAYLLTYALFLDQAPKRQRVKALIPTLMTVFTWLLVYKTLGYGSSGTAYTDPLHDPILYLATMLERAPILLFGQFLFPLPELYNLLFGPARWFVWGIAALGSAAVLWLFLAALIFTPSPEQGRRELALFWLVGMLLALLPATVIFPANRMLFFVGLGGIGLLAQFLSRYIFSRGEATRYGGDLLRQHQAELPHPSAIWNSLPHKLYSLVGFCFIVIHLILAPILLPLFAYSIALFGTIEPAVAQLPLTENEIAVIVTAPSGFYTGYIPYLKQRAGQPVPKAVRVLTTTSYPVHITRLDTHTLSVQPTGGYFVGLASMFRGPGHPLAQNQQIVLPDMTITITELTSSQRPTKVQFHFITPLEDDSLRWFYWHRGEYKPFIVPDVGQTVAVQQW